MSSFKIQVTRKNTAGWVNIFGQRRSMSNWRLLGTAASWLLGIAAIYCSMFYVPAFYDFKRALGISSSAPQIQTERNFLSPYVDLLSQNRSFMMSGQTMEAAYKIDGGSQGKLIFYKCQTPVIIEVFSCNPVTVQEVSLTDSEGRKAIRVNQNGFYGFQLALNDTESKYAVSWRRIF